MKETEIAYIAGIVDGEGSIHISKRTVHDKQKIKTYPYLYLETQITNTNRELMDWLHSCFGGYIGRKAPVGNHNECWTWKLSHQKAKMFLFLIYPFLRIKKHQADVGLEFQKLKKGGGRGGTNNPEKQKFLFERMKELNHRGRVVFQGCK